MSSLITIHDLEPYLGRYCEKKMILMFYISISKSNQFIIINFWRDPGGLVL